MAPQLRILSNVIEVTFYIFSIFFFFIVIRINYTSDANLQRLKNIKDDVTGHLYGVMYNNTLTVLTFSINLTDNVEANINHTMLQLHMSAEVYLCGILHVGQCEEKLPEMFQVNIY